MTSYLISVMMLQPVPLLLRLVKLLPQLIDFFFLVLHYIGQLFNVLFLPHSGILGRLPIPFQLLLLSQFSKGVKLVVGSVPIVRVYIFPWFYELGHFIAVEDFLFLFGASFGLLAFGLFRAEV